MILQNSILIDFPEFLSMRMYWTRNIDYTHRVPGQKNTVQIVQIHLNFTVESSKPTPRQMPQICVIIFVLYLTCFIWWFLWLVT